ncbi:sulfatase-like hydrolase/transferase [Sediminitomix flava]|uniref:Putative secreted protein (Por secretion system target) n=1 Tax=Sediminitomix flava TaxID=379075 RepID=A0A315Z4E8_SEDFL|nr:sulfatase-like hydrolase/transferase [Sediminitomix flava]PWJ37888.1 putative secreted protein (Por secretion system target) [Sediminitomix flava]
MLRIFLKNRMLWFILFIGITTIPAHAQEQKNVLFIMADDFNHWLKKIGYYPESITPNLDALADKGVLFSDAHASSPVCNPSRNAIWSGIRPSTSGISSNGDGYIRDKAGFEKVITMNEYFKQNGYHVFGGGKLYHPGKMQGEEVDPNNWSELYVDGTGSNGGSFYKWESETDGLFKWSAGEFDLNTTGDTKLANATAKWISEYEGEKPFFAAIGLFRPHLPWNAHKQFFDMFNPDDLPTPKGYLTNDADDIKASYNGTQNYKDVIADGVYQEALRAYLANMTYADHNVGIMLDALNESKFKDNTIIVFLGDHGWHLGEKDRFSKHAVFDIAHHTTLIIYNPSAEGNGKVCQKVVSLQDLYPTLVSLCGLDTKSDAQGNDLSPLLADANDTSWDKPIFMSYGDQNIIKTNKWRYVDKGDQSQLYDIENDPYEWTNLYGTEGFTSNSQVVTSLKSQINSMLVEGNQIRINQGNGQAGDGTAPTIYTGKSTTECEGIANLTDLSATRTACQEVTLSWTPDPCATEYIVRRKKDGDATYLNLGNKSEGANSFVDSSVEIGVHYIYQVRPFDGTNKMVSNNPELSITACDEDDDEEQNPTDPNTKLQEATGELVTYPSDNSYEFLPVSDIYEVSVIQDGDTLATTVYKSQSNADDNSRSKEILNNSISWTNFSFSGSAIVRVRLKNGQTKVTYPFAEILPKRKDVQLAKVNERTLDFRLTEAGQYSVEFGADGYKNGLMIFADPMETRPVPEGNSTKICDPCNQNDLTELSAFDAIVFKDNLHDINTWNIPNNIKEVYIEGGAVVRGALHMFDTDNDNTLIHGRGIIDGGGLYYPWTTLKTHGLESNGQVSGVTVEGITLSQAGAFFVRLLGTENKMDWIKTIGGWNFNNDGLVGYKNTHISNSFVWADDDGIKLYRDNQLVENIVMWHLVNGGCFQWAWNSVEAKNVLVRNVDIIHGQWPGDGQNQGVFNCRGSSNGDEEAIKTQQDWTFENINVDTPVKVLFNLAPQFNHKIKNMVFKNVKAEVTSDVINRLAGSSANYAVENISFVGLELNGNCVSSATEGKFKLEHTTNITFSCPSPPSKTVNTLGATIENDCEEIHLSWTDLTEEESYRLMRKEGTEGSFELMAELAQNISAFIDETIESDKTYSYQLYAVFSENEAYASNSVSVDLANCSVVTHSDLLEARSGLHFYPCPVQDTLNIQGLPQGTRVDIYTFEGALIDTFSNKSKAKKELQLNLSHLHSGVYILRTSSDSFQFIKN